VLTTTPRRLLPKLEYADPYLDAAVTSLWHRAKKYRGGLMFTCTCVTLGR